MIFVRVIAHLTEPDSHGNRRCTLNTDPIGVWGPICQLVLYDLPLVLVVLLYPVIFYKSFVGNRQRRRIRTVNEASQWVTRHVSRAASENNDPVVTSPTSALNSAQSPGCCRRPQYGSVSGFVTLTLTTLSAVTCLAPSEVYFTLLLVFNIELSAQYYAIVKVMQSLTVVSDPVLIVLANPELRTLFKNWLTFRCCHRW